MRRPAKRSKYRAVPTVVDGIRFASKKEARRWQELKLLEKAGKVAGLIRQVRYPIMLHGTLLCTYIADFVYFSDEQKIGTTVEDAKGYKTPEYKLKKKLMKAIYGIEIKET